MFGAEVLRDLPGVGKFAKVFFLEADGERFDRLRHHRTHQPNHQARIDPTTQERAQWNLAHQAHPDGILEQCA